MVLKVRGDWICEDERKGQDEKRRVHETKIEENTVIIGSGRKGSFSFKLVKHVDI